MARRRCRSRRADELSRRYGELLGENLGQPNYRELILAAHNLETRRDVVFALIARGQPIALLRRPLRRAGCRPRRRSWWTWRAPDAIT